MGSSEGRERMNSADQEALAHARLELLSNTALLKKFMDKRSDDAEMESFSTTTAEDTDASRPITDTTGHGKTTETKSPSTFPLAETPAAQKLSPLGTPARGKPLVATAISMTSSEEDASTLDSRRTSLNLLAAETTHRPLKAKQFRPLEAAPFSYPPASAFASRGPAPASHLLPPPLLGPPIHGISYVRESIQPPPSMFEVGGTNVLTAFRPPYPGYGSTPLFSHHTLPHSGFSKAASVVHGEGHRVGADGSYDSARGYGRLQTKPQESKEIEKPRAFKGKITKAKKNEEHKYEALIMENQRLKKDAVEKDKEIALLQEKADRLEKQIVELRQLPTGKISHIPIEDMIRIMQEYGSEVSNQTLPRRKQDIKRASIVRQFRRWNPNFLQYFIHVNGEWVPKLGKEGELKRREQKRKEMPFKTKKTAKGNNAISSKNAEDDDGDASSASSTPINASPIFSRIDSEYTKASKTCSN